MSVHLGNPTGHRHHSLPNPLSSPSPSYRRCRPCYLLLFLIVDSTWRSSPRGGSLTPLLCIFGYVGQWSPAQLAKLLGDQDSCARGGTVVDDSVCWWSTLSAELAWYGTMDSPPLCFLPIGFNLIALILDSSWFLICSGRSYRSARVQYNLLRFFGWILLICYEKLPKIELEIPLNHWGKARSDSPIFFS
jgi:hypothetical protein